MYVYTGAHAVTYFYEGDCPNRNFSQVEMYLLCTTCMYNILLSNSDYRHTKV